MAKNADKDDKAVDDGETAAEDLLKAAKYPKDDVETAKEDETSEEEGAKESDEAGEEEGKTDDSQEEESEDSESESDEETSEFVKEFPNIKGETLEDYTRELERTLQFSNTEGKRLSDALKESTKESTSEDTTEEDIGPTDPRLLYLDQILEKEIKESYQEFSKHYPQVNDPAEYDKFRTETQNLSQYFLTTQKRAVPAGELYSKAAAILGWKPQSVDSNDKLKVALKDSAAISRTVTSTKKVPKSKVTDAEVQIAKQLWAGDKSDAEIRKELETVK